MIKDSEFLDSFYSSKTQRGMHSNGHMSPLAREVLQPRKNFNKDLEQEFSESTFENQR